MVTVTASRSFPRGFSLACLGLLLALPIAASAFEPAAAVQVEAAFSPEAGAEALVLATLGSARRTIRLAAYSFTSPPVVRELLAAHRRGVDVHIVVDDKGNRGKASQAALNLVVNAGIPTRAVSAYAIHHDKYAVIDGTTVQTGSFNYSKAAASSNSENVLVVRNNPALAARYTAQWQSRWDLGRDVVSGY